MILSPKIEGNRPRLACEIAAGGVVAARSAEPGGPLTAVARVELAEGAVAPSLKPGNVADRVATIAAVRRAMEAIGARSNARNADLTLVIPDGAVRVLLLDFDALPGKITEALPIVRFRLKKLVPFDTDDAMVTYQVMSSTRSAVRVLAVAIPRDVLADYETVAREAGFEPGAVLPSTLAAVAGLPESDTGSLTVNVYTSAVTTAIARGGVLLLHRTVELTEHAMPIPASLPAALFETSTASELPGMFVSGGVAGEATGELLPLVDVEETAGEWAAQEPLPEFGRNPYADAISAETATEASYGVTGMPLRAAYAGAGGAGADGSEGVRSSYPVDLQELNDSGLFAEGAPVERSPYASPELTEELQSEIHNSSSDGSAAGRDSDRLLRGPICRGGAAVAGGSSGFRARGRRGRGPGTYLVAGCAGRGDCPRGFGRRGLFRGFAECAAGGFAERGAAGSGWIDAHAGGAGFAAGDGSAQPRAGGERGLDDRGDHCRGASEPAGGRGGGSAELRMRS